MPQKKLRLLVVDDHPVVLNGIWQRLKNEFIISGAANDGEARMLLLHRRFDWALLDINLGESSVSGFEIAHWCREVDPNMAIVMMSAQNLMVGRKDHDFDDFVLKTADVEVLMETGLNAVWRRTMSRITRKKRFKVIGPLLEHQASMKFISRTGNNDGAERIDGIMVKDDLPVALVVYNRSERTDNKCYICISSTSGCMGCQMCKSQDRPFKRAWTTSELVSQVLWAMQSYHARGLFDGGKQHLVVNYSTEGDCLFYDPAVACQALEKVYGAISQSAIPFEAIMTSVGHEKHLAMVVENYSYLPITHHWSVHFRPELRARYMRVASSQSLERLRDVYGESAKITGRKVKVAWALAKGINDSQKDVDWLAEFLGNRPFTVNVTLMGEGSLEGMMPASDKDRHDFTGRLRAKGLAAQERVNLGHRISASCGSTVPETYVPGDTEAE